MTTIETTYKGWHIEADDSNSEPHEVIKIDYDAVHTDGRRVQLDVSPYRPLSERTFHQLVDLGFPRRVSNGPLTPEQVESLWKEQFDGRDDRP